MEPVTFTPIGIIHSPFKAAEGTPIQAVGAAGTGGTIEILSEYREGLKDLEGFSHLILLYHLHLVKNTGLVVKPYLDPEPHGIFATRSPGRPNPLGLSIVRLVRVDGETLHIEDLDVIDGTPLLDIKPYVPQLDNRDTGKIGWFENKIEAVYKTRADGRFH